MIDFWEDFQLLASLDDLEEPHQTQTLHVAVVLAFTPNGSHLTSETNPFRAEVCQMPWCLKGLQSSVPHQRRP